MSVMNEDSKTLQQLLGLCLDDCKKADRNRIVDDSLWDMVKNVIESYETHEIAEQFTNFTYFIWDKIRNNDVADYPEITEVVIKSLNIGKYLPHKENDILVVIRSTTASELNAIMTHIRNMVPKIVVAIHKERHPYIKDNGKPGYRIQFCPNANLQYHATKLQILDQLVFV